VLLSMSYSCPVRTCHRSARNDGAGRQPLVVKMVKKTGTTVVQIIVIALITFFMGEIALRIYNHYSPSFVFYDASYNRFRGKPFADHWNFKLNSQGFKDKEFSEEKGDAYRILGIGDSFAFGVVPYQYNYLTLIESQLRPRHPGVEVYNMGIPSIGPEDYLSILVHEGLAFQPDMVLLSFFIGNDFKESRKRKLLEYSYVASLLRHLINLQTRYEGAVANSKAEYCDDCPNFAREHYLKIESKRSAIYLEENERFPAQLDRAVHYLNQIKMISDSLGIDFVVAVLPDEVQVSRDLWRDVRRAHFVDTEEREWDLVRPNRLLAEELNRLGIDHVDLYEHFADELAPRLYKPRDSHWNIAGNQLAADVLGDYILQHLENKSRL